MKRIISVILTIAMFLGISIETFAAYGGEKSRAYQSENCTITYNIANEWSGNQQITISITNDGEETLRNWAVMFDNAGEITNIWNAEVCRNDGELCVIRNNGYNYEIVPNGTVEFGFMLQGNDLSLPEDISLCSRTVESTESAEISYEIQNNWGDGFIAAVTVKNTSEKPLEAWKLSFNGNFGISTIWNANLLYTDDGSFKVENDITTTPIPVGGEKVFSFQGIIASGETPALSDFKLISIVIDTEHTQPEPPVETEEAPSHETTEPSTGDEPEPTTEETNETEEPVDPDPAEPDENTILCFGEYLSEENSIKVYWYSTAEGTVSVHENTDGNGWRKLAEVTDGNSYEFTITEDFVIKYIKVSQQTADVMIESEPFIVAASEDSYVCTWLDSDNDGLPDYAEKIYGTDPENADTDGDGLSDYDEIYKTGTNPLKYDTDEDGVNDADSDNDKDGLTNSEELALGTDPNSADTDGDGLSDYDEINKHNTDPLKTDSDGDTLNDGDEIILGLDPNDPETFGVPDAEYKVKQTISADSEVMERVNTEDSPYELSLEITASGNAQNLIAGSSAYSAITESDARLGGAVSLDYYGGDVEKVKLSYEIGENYVSNEGSEYAKNCVDLQGIKRYNIFRYFEELNMLLPVATEFDEENNTLFAETDELGTYCVLDMEVLLQTFGVNPDGSQTEQVEMQMYAGVNDGYNICFIIDTRKGVITEDQLENIKNEIIAFMSNAEDNNKRIGITICVQANSDLGEDSQSCEYVGYYTSSEELKIALDEINLVNYVGTEDKDDVDFNCLVVSDGVKMMSYQSRGTNNYIFDIYSISYSFFNRSGFAENEQAIIEKNATSTGVNISFISNERKSGSYQTEIPKATGGLMIEGFTDFGKIAYNHVFEEPLVEVEKFNAILATGYQQVELDGKLNSFNGCHSDDDNITDWVEVGGDQWIEMGLFSYDEYNNVVLPTVGQCIDALGDVPFYVEGALAESDFKGSFLNMRVMPITSDPTREDSDGDNYTDEHDLAPLIPFVNPVVFIHGLTDNTYGAFGIPTNACPYYQNKAHPLNNQYNTQETETHESYIDINTHLIDTLNIQQGKIGKYLCNNLYVPNKNMFAFNYPNRDFAHFNADKLSGYINAIKNYVTEQSNSIPQFKAETSDIFATREDLEKGHARFVLIGHSNGGLVSRFYIENKNGYVNVDKLITIDTPHYGSNMASTATALYELGITDLKAIEIVPLTIELRPDSTLFTDNDPLNLYNIVTFVFNPICSKLSMPVSAIYNSLTFQEWYEMFGYVQNNQSEKLKGNEKINNTKYYTIGGVVSVAPESPFVNAVLDIDFKSSFESPNDFLKEVSNALISKYGMEMKELPSLAGDNVVEVYSQFGLQYRSGSFLDSIKTYKSHMFITINQLYTPLNCYHNEILTNLQMQEIVLQYLVE